MIDIVNAEVVETRDFKLRAFWAVLYLDGASQRVSREFGSCEDERSFTRDPLKLVTKYQQIDVQG